jgi:predicted enzyme related to lactoylglutathione lyase
MISYGAIGAPFPSAVDPDPKRQTAEQTAMRPPIRFPRGATAALLLALAACGAPSADDAGAEGPGKEAAMANPVYHFEIPVTDMDRAVRFYEGVLGVKLTRQTIDGYEMALFPRADGQPGASGALAKGDVYVPSKTGAIVYFDVPDIDPVLARAAALGAKTLYPKKHIGAGGHVAEIEDSEGNRLALNALADPD